jgi:ABC-type transport system substrate-binding protein
MNRKILLFCLVALLAVSLTGCKKQRPMPENLQAMLESTQESLVKIGVYGDALSLNPHKHLQSEHALMVNRLIQAAPLRKNVTGEYEPELFESYELSINPQGQMVVKASFRPALYWHDDRPFELKDFWKSLENMRDRQVESPYYETAMGLLSYEANENNEITLVFKDEALKYLDLLTVAILGQAQEEPEAVDKEKAYDTSPVGLGSYRVAERVMGSHMILEPFEKFALRVPENRPRLLIHSVYDVQDLISNLRTKKYHWVNVPSIIVNQLETMGIEGLEISKYANDAHLVWMFNTNNESLANAKVRRALELLIDREALKHQFPMEAKILTASPFSKQEPQDYEARRKEGIKTLEELGFNASNPLKLSILINDDNLARRVLADDMVKMLARAGVQAKVEAVGWGEMVNKRLASKTYSTALLSLALPKRGNWNALLGVGEAGVLNFTGYSNEELNQALVRLNSATFVGDLQAEQAKVAAILDRDCPLAFLLSPYDVSLAMGDAKNSAVKPFHIWDEVLHWSGLFIQKP